MTVRLLDINVLLAIHDHKHDHHDLANSWFSRVFDEGWATCPITENGFIRIASNPNSPNLVGSPDSIARILEQTCTAETHQFWADTLSPIELFRMTYSIYPRHLTDIYLLGLAIAHGGKLATFDRRIPAHLLPGGIEALELIPGTPDHA